MISDVELDRILTAFVAEGGERAPRRDIESALSQVAATPQRRLRPWSRGAMAPSLGPRWVLVAAALLIIAIGIAVGVGSGLLRDPLRPPESVPPAPSPAVIEAPVALVPFAAEDWAVQLALPPGWTLRGDEISEFRDFGGDDPEGHLSVTNENPYGTTICSPDCVEFQVPVTIPYDATAQLEGLRASVGEIAGSDEWTDLPPGVLPGLEGGARVDTTAIAADGRPWRRAHIVGLQARNVVAIAWSQPVDVYDEALAEAIIGGISLGEAPVNSDGDLIPWTTETDYTMVLPGTWFWSEQPKLDGRPLSGVRRYGDGRVVVSLGGPDGTLGWCDPDCRVIREVTSLDALEAAVRDGAVDLGPATPATLGGEPARSMLDAASPDAASPEDRRVVVAMHGDRPVALSLDVGEWTVASGVFDDMVAGFAFIVPAPLPIDQMITTGDRRVEVGLSDAWTASPEDGPIRLGSQELTVQVGDDAGSVTTCTRPAGPWELCREIQATTLEALTDAVQPAPIDDHGVPPPEAGVDATELDGEPAVIVRMQAYEYPAAGGQEVVYIVAMHDDRPYIVRLRTTDDRVEDLDSVIAGFRFVD